MYEAMPDQQLIDMLSEEENGYQDGVYSLLAEEAEKRGLIDKLKQIQIEKAKKKRLKEEKARFEKETEFVCVYRTTSLVEIAVIKSLLEAHSIFYYIDNEHFASLRSVPGGVVDLGVNVTKKFEEEARSLIQEFISSAKAKTVLLPNSVDKNASSVAIRRFNKNTFLRISKIVLGLFGVIAGVLIIGTAIYDYVSSGKEFVASILFFIMGLLTLILGITGIKNKNE